MNFTIATTLDEALAAVAAGARPVAGGSDLVVGARQGKSPLPDSLVAIDRIESLGNIEEAGGGVRIGALVTHARLEADDDIVDRYTALADASALVGSPSTRNVGTLGGNVMNASPAMDTGAPLLVLGAEVELQSTDASRRVVIAELWTAPGRTSAAAGELCVAIHLPSRPADSGSAYVRLEYRRAMEIAVVGAAASVGLDGRRRILPRWRSRSLPSLRRSSPSAEPMRCSGAMSTMRCCAEIASLASEQAAPISDLRASDRYRRHCIGVMARRAVDAADPSSPGRIDRRPRQPQPRDWSSVVSISINLNVNGTDYPVTVDAGRNLVSVLRTEIGLTGTKEGCDDCECGACMVLIDGQPVNSCSYLAAQAGDRPIMTVEGVMVGDQLHPAAAGPARRGWRAMRVLHARHDHVGDGVAERQLLTHRRGDPHRTVRQPVPLHRLRQNPRRRAERRCCCPALSTPADASSVDGAHLDQDRGFGPKDRGVEP